MEVAEKLYNKGLISYPRTETDMFPASYDLMDIVKALAAPRGRQQWCMYAKKMVAECNTMFDYPRQGKLNDNAHPPIHPVKHIEGVNLDRSEQRLYELVVRQFLASVSHDATCANTRIQLKIGSELFSASG